MKTYDLYLFGPLTDIIVGWHKFDSEGDEAATKTAVSMALAGAQELWRDNLLVKRWDEPLAPAPLGKA